MISRSQAPCRTDVVPAVPPLLRDQLPVNVQPEPIIRADGKLPIAGLVKRALQSKAAGQKFVKRYAQQVLDAFNLDFETRFESDQLSRRELDVLKCLDTGMSNQEISEKLFISLNTK